MSSVPRLVVTAPQSGAGKTTVTAALVAAFAARGHTVHPFKIGPDYIDPTHLGAAAGRRARNLDGFFLEEPELLEVFRRGSKSASLAVVEGVMGMFDGKDPLGRVGSTAQVAKWLRAPVLLVIDAKAMAGSIAAVAQGFHHHDPDLKLAGVIANNIGSQRHADILHEALAAVGIPLLGYLPRRKEFALPSRHLGLHMADEIRMDTGELLGATNTLDLDAIYALAAHAPPLPDLPHRLPSEHYPAHVRIAIAHDEAFNFYYPENLEMLEQFGADLVPFSPMSDEVLPPDVGALYLGGGYPERFAAQLSENRAMREALRGFPGAVYAECGGLMYLSDELKTLEGAFPMVGLVAGSATMQSRPTLGYREVEVLQDSPVARTGWMVKGHEFHYSSRPPTTSPAYRSLTGDEKEGFASPQLLASYIHLYFPSKPETARHFVASAARSAVTYR
jgi:cobyrinic acid a,c-diamide synthase